MQIKMNLFINNLHLFFRIEKKINYTKLYKTNNKIKSFQQKKIQN